MQYPVGFSSWDDWTEDDEEAFNRFRSETVMFFLFLVERLVASCSARDSSSTGTSSNADPAAGIALQADVVELSPDQLHVIDIIYEHEA